LRAPNSEHVRGGLFFSLSENCWWCVCCGASPSAPIIAVWKNHLSYTSSRPFWWSSGYSVYSRLHGRYAPGHHGGKCATNSTASCSLPGQWPCLLRSRSLRSITCPVQTGFGSLWALLGSSGCVFSSMRSLIVREFGDAASPLPCADGKHSSSPLRRRRCNRSGARCDRGYRYPPEAVRQFLRRPRRTRSVMLMV